MRAKLGKCKGCGKVHQVPAQINVSQTASPCCGERMKLLTVPRREVEGSSEEMSEAPFEEPAGGPE